MTKIQNSKQNPFEIWRIRILNLFRVSDFGFRISRKGFTLIELVIVVSIVVLLGGAAVVSISSSRNVRQLAVSVDTVLSVLRQAQSRTLAGEDNSPWGVRLDQASVTLFRGASFAAATSTQLFALPDVIEIANINVAGGGSDIVFKRVSGATDQTGSFDIRVKSSLVNTASIIIDTSGQVYRSGTSKPPAGTRITDTRHRNFALGWSIKTSSNLILTFYDLPNPNTVVSVPVAKYLDSINNVFDWSGTATVGGQTQSLRIHTVLLTDTNTTLSVDRDCRYNTKKLNISFDAKDIATYSADCQSVALGAYGGTMTEP